MIFAFETTVASILLIAESWPAKLLTLKFQDVEATVVKAGFKIVVRNVFIFKLFTPLA